MRMPKRGEKGFTLIELLIVVAILGVLAAVIIPNVGRFFGRGEEEARRTEKHNIESAIVALMTENELACIPNAKDVAGGAALNTMTAFPDSISDDSTDGDGNGIMDKVYDPSGTAYDFDAVAPDDKKGYLLYSHDIAADGDAASLVNYITLTSTKYYYTCEQDGTIRQWSDATMSSEYTD